MKIQLNKICFGLPSKAFFIDYTVSQKRQLPVVKEFIVRLLHSLESAQVETIRKYFGFSDSEIQAVLKDLIDESLIVWEEGKVRLSHYALCNFVEIDGHMIPRFFEVTERIDTVSFELHEFKILPNIVKRSRIGDLNLSLSLSGECYKSLSLKAQSAFDSNFQQFREIVKQEDIFSERQELYKINHVSSKYDLVIPIDVEYFVESDSPQILKMGYESNTVDEWDISKSLFTIMDNTVGSLNYKPNYADFSQYLDISNDPLLSNYWNDSKQSLNFDLITNNFAAGTTHSTNDTHLIIGNLYSDFNSKAIFDKLKAINESKEKKEGSGAIWFTNSDCNSWGKCKSLSEFVSDLKSFFDRRKKTSEVILIMHCESNQEAFELNRIYGRLDAKLLGCSSKFGGQACEVLIVPSVMVACLYHASIDDSRNISFPVGYVSFDTKIISQVHNNVIAWTDTKDNINSYFEKKDSEDDETLFTKVYLPILKDLSG